MHQNDARDPYFKVITSIILKELYIVLYFQFTGKQIMTQVLSFISKGAVKT